ncbi:hypothetical protein [Umezawaea beigongshangensis]|uniref:hypothetical protein n=1 Tax=Umezawaea beigongshangensis TaxID=2780383 RepID=UPI0018F21A90|nr:hypothetical protein [Umezawaea beigongshangensis]
MKIAVGSFVVGSGFGAATSLVNALSSPYSGLGVSLAGSVWAGAVTVLSSLIGAGWAWAALAVAMGCLDGTRARGALAGSVALIAVTGAYYVTDAAVLGERVVSYATEMLRWSVAGLVFGSLPGAVGAASRPPGLVGLFAAVTVPVGAAVQMIVQPSRPRLTQPTAGALAEVIVWAGVVLGVCWAVHRFWAARRAVVSNL